MMMKKWGVRLIAIYFLLWAIGEGIALANGTSKAPFYLVSDNIRLDVITPIEICLLLYISFQLIFFVKNGRTWALIVLSWAVLRSGVVFILSWITFNAPLKLGDYQLAYKLDMGLVKSDSPLLISIVAAGMFIAFLMSLYYLLRKDIKALFKPSIIHAITEQAGTGQ
jgi:hypothetical protein